MDKRAMRKALTHARRIGYCAGYYPYPEGGEWWPWLMAWDVRREVKQRVAAMSTQTPDT
jgi:hypothetical protein